MGQRLHGSGCGAVATYREPPEVWSGDGIVVRGGHVSILVKGGGGGAGGGVGFGLNEKEDGSWGGSNLGSSFPKPKEICKGLDKFVIGQERAKKVESSDLIRYGLIPEFVGRFPVLVILSALTEDQLVQGCGVKILYGKGALDCYLSQSKEKDVQIATTEGSDVEPEGEAELSSVVTSM